MSKMRLHLLDVLTVTCEPALLVPGRPAGAVNPRPHLRVGLAEIAHRALEPAPLIAHREDELAAREAAVEVAKQEEPWVVREGVVALRHAHDRLELLLAQETHHFGMPDSLAHGAGAVAGRIAKRVQRRAERRGSRLVEPDAKDLRPSH
jgi:hypothetical protein